MKNYFLKLKHNKFKVFAGVAVVAIVVGGVFFFNQGDGVEQFYTVVAEDFVQEVSVSGTVVATNDVDLAFAESGRVERLAVKVGDMVVRGQALVGLSTGTLQADLLSAQADLDLKRAEANNTGVNLERIREEQDTLVQSAKQKLLSSGLLAVPSSYAVTATPPVITGLYTGTEGTYKLIFSPTEQYSLGDLELRTFDLEKTQPVDVLDSEPTALGTKGLFVQLADDFGEYEDTIWYVTIPNTSSSVYQANYSAYSEAVRARDRAISAAEAEIRKQSATTIAEAGIARAEAAVARIKAQINERTIFAPFSGTVTNVDAKLGGVIGANTTAVSLISDATLEVESFVPEINIPLISVEDPALVTLDAYGDAPFEAQVIFIDPAETVRDGVSTYRIKLELADDERIRAGMTANVTITTEKKSDVLTVPQGVVISRDGKKFVRVQTGGELVDREVTLGGVSSVGKVEILSGLNAGELVLLSTSE